MLFIKTVVKFSLYLVITVYLKSLHMSIHIDGNTRKAQIQYRNIQSSIMEGNRRINHGVPALQDTKLHSKLIKAPKYYAILIETFTCNKARKEVVNYKPFLF